MFVFFNIKMCNNTVYRIVVVVYMFSLYLFDVSVMRLSVRGSYSFIYSDDVKYYGLLFCSDVWVEEDMVVVSC